MAEPTSNADSDRFMDEMKALYPAIKKRDEVWSRLVKHARGSVLVYDANLRGYRQQDCESSTFKHVAEIKSFLQRTPQQSAAQISEKFPVPLTQAVECPNYISFLEIPLEKHRGRDGMVVAMTRALGFLNADWSPSLSTMENLTSTTGRILHSPDRTWTQFWTPFNSKPFLHLSLVKVKSEGIQRQWLAVLAYDKAGRWPERGIANGKKRFETYSHKADSSHPNPTEEAPFHAFADMLNHFIALYIKTIRKEVEELKKAIQRKEDSITSKQNLSDVLGSLNLFSHVIRASNLEAQFVFSTEAAEWAHYVLRPLKLDLKLRDLLMMNRQMGKYHPDRLREAIAEVRQQVNDTIEERQQKRQEQLQVRQDARAKEEWDLLQKNLKIAEATLRDSRLMSGVAWITMAFLPATFVSSFFGMNFFSGKAGYPPFDEGSKNVWIFFLVALPITAVVLGGFWYWNRQEKKKDDGKLRSVEEGATKNQDGATTAQSTGNGFELSTLPSRVSHS
ncbi:hypothetical protein J4E81_008283 [Alternaria sp. BMP 2799]|nr:hypothetical protein J4E81_008283 [Alternaria sp. BMP 2799]